MTNCTNNNLINTNATIHDYAQKYFPYLNLCLDNQNISIVPFLRHFVDTIPKRCKPIGSKLAPGVTKVVSRNLCSFVTKSFYKSTSTNLNL